MMDESNPTNEATSRLAALAAEGRQRQAAALAAEAAEEQRIERRRRREVERLGRSNVANALLERSRGPALPLLRFSIALVVTGTVLLLAPGVVGLPQPIGPSLGLALIVLGGGGYFVARKLAAPRLVRAELAWLRALPFPVRGYAATLGESPGEERRVRVHLEFRGAAPEHEVLEGLFGRVTFPATARITEGRGAGWTAESGPIRSVALDDLDPTNGPVLSWMRSVVDEVLLPLHAAFPLRGVEFGD
jgi:hypothetical protein